jgi:Pentapeptide repeats (8 copies)
MQPWRRIRTKLEPLTTGGIVLALIALAVLVFFVLPPLIVSRDDVPNAAQRLKLENDVRTTGVQLLAGAVLALGAFFTARTIRINREGQITERFTRAIDHLGSKELDVRLGGIYALERIARDSRRDHTPIMEVLTAYIAGHSRRVVPALSAVARPEHPPADIQAALNVLGRRKTGDEDEPFLTVLTEVDLHGADFGLGRFETAMFMRSDLEKASFFGADLRWAMLNEARLAQAVFNEADMRGVHLTDADLSKSAFWKADIEDGYLENAILREASLEEAHLRGANLEGANLEGANLKGANLEGANLRGGEVGRLGL